MKILRITNYSKTIRKGLFRKKEKIQIEESELFLNNITYIGLPEEYHICNYVSLFSREDEIYYSIEIKYNIKYNIPNQYITDYNKERLLETRLKILKLIYPNFQTIIL